MDKVNWLKVRAVANRLSVSEKTVYNWLKSGQLVGRKIGKSWVIGEDAIDRLLHQPPVASAPAIARQAERLSVVDVAHRFAELLDGAARNGIVNILEPRRVSGEADAQMNRALELASGEVLVAGIGLPAFFNEQGRHIFTLRQMQAEDRAVHIRALLLHPVSEFAKSRAKLEANTKNGDDEGEDLILSPFYASAVLSLHLLTAMCEGAQLNARYKLEAKFAHYWPAAHILLTESVCFVEQYHFGLFSARQGAHAEGNVPVFVAETGSDLYNAMKSHFEYIWRGKDPHIKVRSLAETGLDISP